MHEVPQFESSQKKPRPRRLAKGTIHPPMDAVEMNEQDRAGMADAIKAANEDAGNELSPADMEEITEAEARGIEEAKAQIAEEKDEIVSDADKARMLEAVKRRTMAKEEQQRSVGRDRRLHARASDTATREHMQQSQRAFDERLEAESEPYKERRDAVNRATLADVEHAAEAERKAKLKAHGTNYAQAHKETIDALPDLTEHAEPVSPPLPPGSGTRKLAWWEKLGRWFSE